MKISTRGRYALRLMIDVALHEDEGAVSLTDIAQRQRVSKKYLEQIVAILGKAELLSTSRGTKGGCMLCKPLEEYNVGEILRATEGSLAPVTCLQGDENSCVMKAECATLPLWQGLYKVVDDYLSGISLKDIVDKAKG